MKSRTPSKAIAYPNGVCWGCGEPLSNPTKFFHPSHDRIAEAKVIREFYGNVANFVLAHGYAPKPQK
jgi:hypothetical protein